jgi:PPOX class probable F420-dependent enzyme
MAKQRDAIQMTPAEQDRFLSEVKSMIIATLDKDGAPHQTVLWFAVKDGKYLFETYGRSQKVVNLRRDPRISLLWEDGRTYKELRGLSVQGEAEIVDAEPRLSELMTYIADGNSPPASREERAAHVARMVQKRVVISVTPKRTISWDHRKIA